MLNDTTYTAASEIILPPGSTGADLQGAIDYAASGDTIVITGDMSFTDVVTLPSGKEITIQSDQSDAGHNGALRGNGDLCDNGALRGNWALRQPNPDVRHFTVGGMLILRHITLDGMHSSMATGGGGVNVTDGSLILQEGVTIQNCYARNSGGAIYVSNGIFTMIGGVIRNNITEADGGGIFLMNGDFTMIGGIIHDNEARIDGGGVFARLTNLFVTDEGKINNNKADSGGGGIFVSTVSTFVLLDGVISGNTANYGAGIYLTESTVDINVGLISDNTAVYGGGIYVRGFNFSGVHTGIHTLFRCNRAGSAHEPPANAETLYPNMQFAGVTISYHPLNNYDISYMSSPVFDASVRITYVANGGSGRYTGPSVAPCDTDTTLPVADTGITRYGYTCTYWNTLPDGSGDGYAPDAPIVLSRDIILYAQWEANIYTVAYDANGGTGGVSYPAAYDSVYVVRSLKETGISRMMHMLTSWNTRPDGTGATYRKGDTFVVPGDVTLYAQWRKITRSDTANLVLVSVAVEELVAAQILNTAGESFQHILGAMERAKPDTGASGPGVITACDIMAVNNRVQKTIRDVIKTTMLMQIRMEDIAGLDEE